MQDDNQGDVTEYITRSVRVAADDLVSQALPQYSRSDAQSSKRVTTAGGIHLSGGMLRGTFWVGVASPATEVARGELYRDWIGELANQLAGRVKNQLLKMGLDCNTCPPVMLEGQNLQEALAQAKTNLNYESPDGSCKVWAVFEVIPPACLRAVEEEDAPIEEGDFIMF